MFLLQVIEYDFEFGIECFYLVLKYIGVKVWLVEGLDFLWKVGGDKN